MLPIIKMLRVAVLGLCALALAQRAEGSSITFSATAVNAAGIQATVDAYRAALGTLNPNVAGSFGSGRREINWDGVPDALSAANNLPANFFNVNSPRGVVLSTPGTGFQVSATAASGTPVEFSNIDPNYSSFFATFSAQRLFTALGSTITDINFFVPGTNTPAGTNAFGAVFSDVDLANTSSIQYFDLLGNSLGTFFVPAIGGNETLSFLGVQFVSGEQIGRVRITSGSQVLAAGNTLSDLTVMDDFIYGEPIGTAAAVPEPGTILLSLTGLGALAFARARKKTEAN
jgi:hypothetical protein